MGLKSVLSQLNKWILLKVGETKGLLQIEKSIVSAGFIESFELLAECLGMHLNNQKFKWTLVGLLQLIK